MSTAGLLASDRATLHRFMLLIDAIADKPPETPTSSEELSLASEGGIKTLHAAMMDWGLRLQVYIDPEDYGLATDDFGGSEVYEEVVDAVVASGRAAAETYGWTKYFEHHEVTRESEGVTYGEFSSRERDGLVVVEVGLSLSGIPAVNEPVETDADEAEEEAEPPEIPFEEMDVQALGEYADNHPTNADAAAELMKRALETNPLVKGIDRRHGNEIVVIQPKSGPSLSSFGVDYDYNIQHISSVDMTNKTLPEYDEEGETVVTLRVCGIREEYQGRTRPDLSF